MSLLRSMRSAKVVPVCSVWLALGDSRCSGDRDDPTLWWTPYKSPNCKKYIDSFSYILRDLLQLYRGRASLSRDVLLRTVSQRPGCLLDPPGARYFCNNARQRCWDPPFPHSRCTIRVLPCRTDMPRIAGTPRSSSAWVLPLCRAAYVFKKRALRALYFYIKHAERCGWW